MTPASSSTVAHKKAKRIGDMIVGRFLKALLKSDHDRWNVELRAPKSAPAVALRTPESRRVEE